MIKWKKIFFAFPVILTTPLVVVACGDNTPWAATYVNNDENNPYITIDEQTLTFTLDLSKATNLTAIPNKAFKFANTRFITRNVKNSDGKSDVTKSYRLNKIIFPNSLKSIGDYAFVNLQEVKNNILQPKTRIEYLDFSKAENLTSIGEFAFDFNQIENLVLPKNLQVIGKGAFAHNHISNLQFDNINQINSIGSGAFANNKLDSNSNSFQFNSKTKLGTGIFDNQNK